MNNLKTNKIKLKFKKPIARLSATNTMETIKKTIEEISKGEYCPLPISVIPNYMGINLISVESISWTKQEDGQLIDLKINFIPFNK